ncbi:hypothetical protein RHGRI_030977 [Rhododendron griersonianum]|uniref:Reverse transcriptase n=2 Tax=Rhododendron griersonianum TaxID=479676 RepID=A0AAV6I626_9ERIC|nr:hypothetical protein RHGRI_030977 [Rhododendron griersonianum]
MLKVWSKKKFGNNKDRINDLKAQLSTIQNNPFSNEGFKQEQEIKKELELTLLREEMYQHQRSRLNWKKFGDKNTAFFHAVVTQRRQRNQLLQIKDRNGSWIKEERGINMHLYRFFSDLFKSSGPRDFSSVLDKVECTVTCEMNRNLTKETTNVEIKEAAFQLGSLKAPGPDGFPGYFYHQFWDIVGEGVCKAVKRFFAEGFSSKNSIQPTW